MTTQQYADYEARVEDRSRENAALIAHAFNVLPKVVAALERAVSIIEDLPYPDDAPARSMRTTLAEANNVNL